MEKYLSIVEKHLKHSNQDINETKLKQFLAKTKVWEYARISEQDYTEMSIVDRFEHLKDHYNYMNKTTNHGQIDIATANRIKQTNVVTLTKEGAGSNFSTRLIAENANQIFSEIAGEPVWSKF